MLWVVSLFACPAYGRTQHENTFVMRVTASSEVDERTKAKHFVWDEHTLSLANSICRCRCCAKHFVRDDHKSCSIPNIVSCLARIDLLLRSIVTLRSKFSYRSMDNVIYVSKWLDCALICSDVSSNNMNSRIWLCRLFSDTEPSNL
jgi:hypothetical protein